MGYAECDRYITDGKYKEQRYRISVLLAWRTLIKTTAISTFVCLFYSVYYPIKFMHAVRFNADISTWNMSSLTNTSEAFFGAISFNSDVSAWNVSSVKDFGRMVRSIPTNMIR